MTWQKISPADALKPGSCLGVEIGAEYVAVYNIAGRYYATDNICTHQLAFLSEGAMEGEYIECPMHQGRFHVPTGAAQGEPVTESLRIYPVKVEDGNLYVQIDDDAAV